MATLRLLLTLNASWLRVVYVSRGCSTAHSTYSPQPSKHPCRSPKYPTKPLYPNNSQLRDSTDKDIAYATSYYALSAIVVHHGASIASGHYTSFIRTAPPALCSNCQDCSQQR
jgi:hypothetical protein